MTNLMALLMAVAPPIQEDDLTPEQALQLLEDAHRLMREAEERLNDLRALELEKAGR